jgi:branched-chain amino acid transport system substrate-binding protein
MRVRPVGGSFAVIVAGAILAMIAGCGSAEPSPLTSVDEGQVHLFGTDGNMSNGFGDVLKDQPGVLLGMKGTTALTPLSEDFKRRVRSIDPSLDNYNYAGESYDAVMIAALAAETARTSDPLVVAKYVVGVTTGGDTCQSARACLDMIHSGHNVQYRGISLRRSGLTDAGEPSTAMYATLNFGRDNHIDDGKTEFVGAGEESAQSKSTAPPTPSQPYRPGKIGAQLKIGGLLPHTGALAFAGPPLFDGARLAVKEINEAGGVLGQPVEWVDGDDGTNPQVASATVDRFVSMGVQVIIGAAASGICAAIMPKVVAAGRLMISPSATSDALSSIDDHGLFFRTSPPDVLQAKALADIVMREGSQRIVVVARDDNYGMGFAKNVQGDLASAGIRASNIKIVTYKAKDKYDLDHDLGPMFGPVAKSVKQFAPDAVVIIGFDESALVLKAMLAQNIKLKS